MSAPEWSDEDDISEASMHESDEDDVPLAKRKKFLAAASTAKKAPPKPRGKVCGRAQLPIILTPV